MLAHAKELLNVEERELKWGRENGGREYPKKVSQDRKRQRGLLA